MLDWLPACPKTAERLACSPLRQHLTGYLAHLTLQRYSPNTMRKYADYLLDFGEFLSQQGTLDVAQFSQAVGPFLMQLASTHPRATKMKSTVNCFLRYLRQEGVIPTLAPPGRPHPHAQLVEDYCTSLRNLRALNERTIRRIRGTSRRFMAFLAADSDASLYTLQPEVVHRFLVARGQQCCRSSLRTQCSALRGYLASLHRCGAVALDLSGLVIAPRVYQHDGCPRYLTRSQIDAVLAVVDRGTPVGRRDYAMLVLLTAYGLRGTEVTRLRLEDVDWRNNQLHIRGRKSGNNTTYPLAASVADAIVAYLRQGRPISPHREVFLAVIAPFRPLANGAALACHLVKYLQQAGITVPRPGTHLFRYSCAQRLFEEGMSLKCIGDYLGHTDLHSTRRYTKIALDQLREVALGDAEGLL
jgi:site-specific recombinase XerD